MTYIARRPDIAESADVLQARIPGWGADLDPADRPAVPQERFDPPAGGADHLPPRQPELVPRERSIEHAMLTPVFGTSCPPRWLSGRIRRYAYRRYGEGRLAHWLLLMAADRVDVVESAVAGAATGRPDNLPAETGIRAEFAGHGIASRRGRVDVRHQWIDPLLVAGPWVGAAAVSIGVLRRLRRSS